MKKNILIFVAGMVTAVVILYIIASCIEPKTKSIGGRSYQERAGVTLFDEPGDCVECQEFEVFQVLPSGDALADGKLSSLDVLFLEQDGKSYYDGQVIRVPEGKCARQIGVYRYESKGGFDRTVPIVEIR